MYCLRSARRNETLRRPPSHSTQYQRLVSTCKRLVPKVIFAGICSWSRQVHMCKRSNPVSARCHVGRQLHVLALNFSCHAEDLQREGYSEKTDSTGRISRKPDSHSAAEIHDHVHPAETTASAWHPISIHNTLDATDMINFEIRSTSIHQTPINTVNLDTQILRSLSPGASDGPPAT